jgi:hypothetical protein
MKSIQIPDDLYQKAEALAAHDQVSVDKLVAALLLAHASEWQRLQARAEHGSVSKLQAALDKVSDNPPEAFDHL